MANNPILYADPDGKFIPLLAIGIGAFVGGTFNVVSHLASGKAMSFRDGVVAFGIGAIAGGLGVATAGST